MNTEPRPPEAHAALVEQLVAYLDGELEPPARRAIEQRLAEDAECQRILRQLQRSWDLLDELPKSDADEAFTQTTLSMVTVAAKDDAEKNVASRRRQLRIAQWIGGTAAVAACLASYLIVSWFADGPNRELLRDLPVVQHLDEYRYAENVQFLRLLEREGLFVEEPVSEELP